MPSCPSANDGGEKARRPAGDTSPRARSAQQRRRSPPAGPSGDRAAAEELGPESCASLREAGLSIAPGPLPDSLDLGDVDRGRTGSSTPDRAAACERADPPPAVPGTARAQRT